jgi:hypothetical protein
MVDKNRTKEQISDSWPIFFHGHVAIARWMHPDGKHRVYLIARSDGLFIHSGERFLDDPNEMCWTCDNVHTGLYASEQIAVREIEAIYPWTCGVPLEERPIRK